MDENYVIKARTFVRFCLHCATSSVLNLSAEECLNLYKELYTMADFLQDKDTMMLVCNKLGLLFKKLQLYNEALQYQQLHLILATEGENKAAQTEAYKNLGNVYLLVNKYQDALSCYEKATSIAIKIGDKESEGACCGNMGVIYNSLGHHGDGIKSFKQCLAVALETSNTTYQKIVYFNMGVAYNVMKDFPQVINYYTEWLKIATKDDEQDKGQVYAILGIAYQELNNSQQAIECCEKSLEIAKKLEDQRMEINAYKRLAISYIYQAHFQKAIEYIGKELELAIKLDDKISETIAYGNLGTVYEKLGNYAKAIELNEKALAIAVTTDNKSDEAPVNGSLGNCYQSQGEYHKAIKYHERQLQIATDIGSKDGQQEAYSSLGIDYKSLGNYYEAVKYHTNALEMSVEIGNKRGEQATLCNLGIVYHLLGQYQDAIAYCTKSIEIARQIEYRYGEGRAIGNLATSLTTIGNFKEAVRCIEESLKIAQEVNDRQSEANAYGNLGKCKANLSQYNEALEMLDKKIRLAKEMGDKHQQAMGYGAKGEVYLELNDHQQAFDCFEKQLKISKQTDDKHLEANSYGNFRNAYGNLFEKYKNSNEHEKEEQCIAKSIHYTRELLRCREWLFDHLQEHDHFKISILETFIQEYNCLTVLLVLNNEHKEALLVSERGRARALVDLLVSKYNLNQDNQPGRRDPISYAEIENMGSDCSILFYTCHSTFYCIWIINPIESYYKLFSTDEDRFFDIVNSAYNTLKVREVQCEDRSVEVDKPQEKQHLSVPQKSDSLDVTEKLLLSSYEKIKERCGYKEDLCAEDDDNPNPLEVLYKALISPVLHLLTKDEIIIIPDGALFTVPFATLQDPNTGEYLSETKRIRLAPSLTSLKALQECPADFHSKTGALVIGNPQVGKVMFKGKTKEIHDLPDAELEAKMIGELLGVKPFIGSQATKEAIKQNLREGVAVIHFAAHGTTDGEIFLTPSTTGDLPSEQDYILTMKEVQESGVRPQLVVLSCCHSGRGEIKAEGVVGMSRAFLAAGARAVVASLWAIADEATMVFMEKFYTHLKQGESASKSLHAAMKDMREIPRYNDPQFWAPFFLIGDDVTITMWCKRKRKRRRGSAEDPSLLKKRITGNYVL